MADKNTPTENAPPDEVPVQSKSEDAERLEKVIAALDDQLIAAYSQYQQLTQETFGNVSRFDDPETRTAWENYLNEITSKWSQDVANILQRDLKYNYHLYHFLSAKPVFSSSYSGVSRKISGLLQGMESRMNALEEVILRLEEKLSLSIRREIAEKEHQGDLLYQITYSDHLREIKLNGLLITKPDFESENHQFFSYIYINPNRRVSRKEIEKSLKIDLKKTNSDILRDLGFKGTLRQLFFPGATKSKVLFNNPITKEYAIKHDLPTINFNELKRNKEV